jgi:hypothetical protein
MVLAARIVRSALAYKNRLSRKHVKKIFKLVAMRRNMKNACPSRLYA